VIVGVGPPARGRRCRSFCIRVTDAPRWRAGWRPSGGGTRRVAEVSLRGPIAHHRGACSRPSLPAGGGTSAPRLAGAARARRL